MAHPAQSHTERKLLVALCQPALSSEVRAAILARLKKHVFAEADHEVIYRALASLPAIDSNGLPNNLAQAVTRLGFPDMDIESFVNETPPAPDTIAALLQHL
jgi:hypothetical protein